MDGDATAAASWFVLRYAQNEPRKRNRCEGKRNPWYYKAPEHVFMYSGAFLRLKSGPTMEVAVRPALWHPAVVEWCGAPQAAHCNFKSRLRQISTCKEPIGELYCCRNPAKAGEAHFLGGRFIHLPNNHIPLRALHFVLWEEIVVYVCQLFWGPVPSQGVRWTQCQAQSLDQFSVWVPPVTGRNA